MGWRSVLLAGTCLLFASCAGQRLPKLACYYGTWAMYSGLKPEQIDPDLCTSIIISFVGVRDDLTDIVPLGSQDLKKVYPAMLKLKGRSQSGLNLVIALGGANHDNSKFDRMIRNAQKLRQFSENTVKTIRDWGMDGIDVDWEFPKDPAQHVQFIGSLRAAIDREVLSAGQRRLELSAALSAGSYIKSFDIPLIGSLLDIGYVMTYDYHGPWEKITGHNSPLFAREDDTNKQLNTAWSLNHYYLKGFPKEKLYIGMPTYARTFRLRSPTVNGVRAPFVGGGTKPYSHVCSTMKNSLTAFEVWDSESQVPYAVDGIDWISFANTRSVSNKCQWAAQNGFAGAMVWSLHQDDFKGECGQGTFPLIRAIKACSQTFPTPVPPTTTPAPPGPKPSELCAGKTGFEEIPGACEKFAQCVNGRAIIKSCQRGLHFSSKCICCNYPSLARRENCDGPTETPSSTISTSAKSPPTTPSAPPTTPSAPPTTPSAPPTTPPTAAPTTLPSTTPSTVASTSTQSPTVSTNSPEGKPFAGKARNIACYYGTWGRYSGLKPKDIDPTVCTSVLISFVQVREDLLNIAPFDESDVKQVFPVFVAMKRKYGLKLVIALGGASHANSRFDKMIRSKSTLRRFAVNTVRQLRDWHMDGLDVDWEFPTNKAEHVLFLKALRGAFNEEAEEKGVETLELSAALPAGHYINNYDIEAIGKLLDIGYVMAYDYHGPWESFTGHNSPLFPRQDDKNQRLNADWTMKRWVEGKFPREKLYFGVPTYARTFRVANPERTGFGVGVKAFGIQTLTYRQVCKDVLSKPTTRRFWDGQSLVPYAVTKDNIWVSYANGTSLANKCAYADMNGYGGLMVWSLHQDDYDGYCNGETLSLVRALKACSGRLPAPTPLPPTRPTTTRSTTTTTTPAPVTGTIDGRSCENMPAGFYPVARDCSAFIQCVGGRTHKFKCQTGLVFSPKCDCCDYPEVAGRKNCTKGDVGLPVQSTASLIPSTTLPPADVQYCSGREDGDYAVFGACSLFYKCSNGYAFREQCDFPTLFNPRLGLCDNRAQVALVRDDCNIRTNS